ncbi:hypothetical protein MBLNU459_g4957t1 [Dothideomycetes sp. NU459]
MRPMRINTAIPPVVDDPNSAGSTVSIITPSTGHFKEEERESRLSLFGDVPEGKRRKFILVDDQARGTRVRVRVLLDAVKMEDMPDSHLRVNSVYPRSYYPRQMRSLAPSPHHSGLWDDADDSSDEEAAAAAPTASPAAGRGRVVVRCPLLDGSHAQLYAPRLTKERRARECALNELGYRMSWSQAKTFNERPIFMQKSPYSVVS